MCLNSAMRGDVLVVSVEAERIDAALAIRFKEDMRRETDAGPDRVVLDLSSVDFVDSSGLGAIVAAMKQIRKPRRMDLAGLQPAVLKVFRLTRMDSVFQIYPDLDTAVTSDAA